jgi:hypothetical protein
MAKFDVALGRLHEKQALLSGTLGTGSAFLRTEENCRKPFSRWPICRTFQDYTLPFR